PTEGLDAGGAWADPAAVVQVSHNISSVQFQHEALRLAASLRRRLAAKRPRSIVVPLRMADVPFPRRLDDRPQVGVARLPAQPLLNPLRRRPQRRRAARAPRPLLYRHRLAGHRLRRLDDLANAVTTADAQVVTVPLPRLQLLQRQQVSLRQVIDVDVIANAGP